jgi:cytidylate kinase
MLGTAQSSFIIDQKITPARIHLISSILSRSADVPYSNLKILLTAPMDVLRRRVTERNACEGKYQGTLSELEDSVSKIGEFETSRFTSVFDTSALSVDDIVEEIRTLLDSFK